MTKKMLKKIKLREGLKNGIFNFLGGVPQGSFSIFHFFLVPNDLKINFRLKIFFMYGGDPPWASSSSTLGFIDTHYSDKTMSRLKLRVPWTKFLVLRPSLRVASGIRRVVSLMIKSYI